MRLLNQFLKSNRFDQLPKTIKESKILSGHDLAILASIEKIPLKKDFALRNENNTTENHILAKAFLAEEKNEEAWQLLLKTKKYIMAFKLPELNYSYDALEPHIDAKTMEIHHSKHHNGYTNNLNTAISGTEMENMTIGRNM